MNKRRGEQNNLAIKILRRSRLGNSVCGDKINNKWQQLVFKTKRFCEYIGCNRKNSLDVLMKLEKKNEWLSHSLNMGNQEGGKTLMSRQKKTMKDSRKI